MEEEGRRDRHDHGISPVDHKEFRDVFSKVYESHGYKGFVKLKDDYSDCRAFLSKDKKSGFALSEDGDEDANSYYPLTRNKENEPEWPDNICTYFVLGSSSIFRNSASRDALPDCITTKEKTVSKRNLL